MLDDLLGRTELRERIDELETERRHLQRELDAEQERRADAQTARQQAEERVNRLEDRIEQLEDALDRRERGEREPEPAHAESLRDARLDTILGRLDSFVAGPEGVLTAYVRDGSALPDAVRDAFGSRAAVVARSAPCLAVTDDASLLGACLSVPVPPDPFVTWDTTVSIDRAWFEPRGTYTLALVRSDLFAMGTYDGTNRRGFHGFTADLKRQHSKGGFSQRRFERLRDEQIEDHVGRCRAALAERDADPLYLVGERTVLDEFTDEGAVTRTVDATGDPESALADAWRSFWTVQLRTV